MRFKGIGVVVFGIACAVGAATQAGCAHSKTKGVDENGRAYEVVCADEAPTGSNISRFRCYRRWQVEDRRQQDRAAMERIQFDTKRPAIHGGGGGQQQRVVQNSGGGISSGSATALFAR